MEMRGGPMHSCGRGDIMNPDATVQKKDIASPALHYIATQATPDVVGPYLYENFDGEPRTCCGDVGNNDGECVRGVGGGGGGFGESRRNSSCPHLMPTHACNVRTIASTTATPSSLTWKRHPIASYSRPMMHSLSSRMSRYPVPVVGAAYTTLFSKPAMAVGRLGGIAVANMLLRSAWTVTSGMLARSGTVASGRSSAIDSSCERKYGF
jgi:hypothetical protein